MGKTFLVIGVCAVIAGLSFFAPIVLNAVFDALDIVLGWIGPFWMVVLVSALVGLLFILAFPHVSAQGGIRTVKDRIKFNLLGIRIFQDDLPTVVKSTGGTLGWNFAYLGMNLLPMVFLAAPFMVVWFQLNSLYAFDSLEVGDEKVVVAQLRDDVDPTQVELLPPEAGEGGPGWSIVQGPVAIAGGPGERWLNFTLRAEREGVYELSYRHQGETITKDLAIGEKPRRLAKVRTASPWAHFVKAEDPIIYFGEKVLPKDAFVQTVLIDYPAAPLGPFGGGEITIMLVFLVVSLAVGFGLKGVFGVEI